ncbi:hypothetical protein [Alloalcanivorax xenomutans]
MADTIDELLVKLGLETDRDSFKNGIAMFGRVRAAALAFGAAIGVVTGGIGAATNAFARETDAMGKFSQVYGTSAQFVDALGYALERQGGRADDAFASIKRVRDLIESSDWGEVPLEAFRVAGFDPMLLAGVRDIEDAYDRLSAAGSRLDTESRRRAFSALGFDDAEIRLFAGGPGEMRDLLNEAKRLAPVTQEMVDNAARYQDAGTKLSKAIDGIVDLLGNKFAPAISGAAERLADFLAENRENIGAVVDRVMETSSRTSRGLSSAHDRAWSGDPVGAGGEIFNAGIQLFSDFIDAALNIAGQEDLLRDLRDQIRATGEGLRVQPPMALPDAPPPGPSATTSGQTFHQENHINVDARGSTNPGETERAVENAANRALSRAAQNAVERTESPYR